MCVRVCVCTDITLKDSLLSMYSRVSVMKVKEEG